MHTHWTHYIQVLSGEAVLIYGGTVSNAKETSPGQIRGDAIVGGTKMTVRPAISCRSRRGCRISSLSQAPGAKFHYVVFNTRV